MDGREGDKVGRFCGYEKLQYGHERVTPSEEQDREVHAGGEARKGVEAEAEAELNTPAQVGAQLGGASDITRIRTRHGAV